MEISTYPLFCSCPFRDMFKKIKKVKILTLILNYNLMISSKLLKNFTDHFYENIKEEIL